MAHNFIPKRKFNSTMLMGWEKHLLEKHYDFLTATTSGNTLICTGQCQPSEFSIKYNYKLKWQVGDKPRVYAVNPKISYNKNIHMYADDNRLCLYYPKDFSWTSDSHLYNTIIPWTHEWFVFYELYQIYGRWIHPEVKHNNIKI